MKSAWNGRDNRDLRAYFSRHVNKHWARYLSRHLRIFGSWHWVCNYDGPRQRGGRAAAACEHPFPRGGTMEKSANRRNPDRKACVSAPLAVDVTDVSLT